MRDRTVTISSAGKTFSCTGWKVGWVCAAPELVDAVMKVKQFLTYTNAAPLQPAVATALRLPRSYYADAATALHAKRDVLCAGLAEAGFEVYRPAGTYFVTADVRAFGETDGLAFCRSLPERCGVVAVPVRVFYDDPYVGRSLVRFAFCKRDDVLGEALRRLRVLAPAWRATPAT
jgi:N-succinyldiaminopimelate aminotransferase